MLQFQILQTNSEEYRIVDPELQETLLNSLNVAHFFDLFEIVADDHNYEIKDVELYLGPDDDETIPALKLQRDPRTQLLQLTIPVEITYNIIRECSMFGPDGLDGIEYREEDAKEILELNFLINLNASSFVEGLQLPEPNKVFAQSDCFFAKRSSQYQAGLTGLANAAAEIEAVQQIEELFKCFKFLAENIADPHLEQAILSSTIGRSFFRTEQKILELVGAQLKEKIIERLRSLLQQEKKSSLKL